MKIDHKEVGNAFNGLAIAAGRVKELVQAHGKQSLTKGMPQRQLDGIRQNLLDVQRDLKIIVDEMK
ncbi:MAG: hypothetical protein R3C28_33520 [Pirellulaceae bacterium]